MKHVKRNSHIFCGVIFATLKHFYSRNVYYKGIDVLLHYFKHNIRNGLNLLDLCTHDLTFSSS